MIVAEKCVPCGGSSPLRARFRSGDLSDSTPHSGSLPWFFVLRVPETKDRSPE